MNARLTGSQRTQLERLARIVAPAYRKGGDRAVDEVISEMAHQGHALGAYWAPRLEMEPAVSRAFARVLKSYLAD